MKQLRSLFCLMFVLGILFSQPLCVFAQKEHGGKEHAGAGSAEGGALAPAVSEADEAAILKESADALEATRPDLAAKLRALAANEE